MWKSIYNGIFYMRYLVVKAGYLSVGISDQFADDFDQKDLQEDLGISDSLWNEITQWVRDYSVITSPFSKGGGVLPSSLEKINELDQRGIDLIEKLLNEFDFDVKIVYKSEGMYYCPSYLKHQNKFDNKLFYQRKGEKYKSKQV